MEENNIYYIMTLKNPTPLFVHSADSKTSTEVHIMQGGTLSLESSLS